jgi:hypothetical protein
MRDHPRSKARAGQRRFSGRSTILSPRAGTPFAPWASPSGAPEALEFALAARIIAFFRTVDRERLARAEPLRP